MSRQGAPVFRSAVRLHRHIEDTVGGAVVLANGCFDPLHVGHVRYLYGAREYGDFLVVAVNDDKSTRALKGARRPIMPAADRAHLVAQLEMVDAVLVFSASDVRRILDKLRPRYHAKGTDYTADTVPERGTSRKLGIETVIVGDPKSHASRDIVRKIKGAAAGNGVGGV
ncbi:MAG: adenylyltransferase/cytidyltransferase family protein [Candidatus Krumholzibacteriia bacterium]